MLACLADETGRDQWSLGKSVVAVPKKGNTKLKTALERDAARARDGGPVVFVFDQDHVRGLFGLAARACKSEVLEAAAGLCLVKVGVVLLENNVEDLLNACLSATGKPALESKPDPNDRDSIFQSTAAQDRTVRDRLRENVPSFDRLVRYVKDHLPKD